MGERMRTVNEILDEKGHSVWWIDPLESVFAAAKMMSDRKVGALLVQIDGYIVGIVSERDYVTKVILDHKTSQKTRVSEIMTRNVISVTRRDSAEHCIDLMKEHHFRHLPVVEDGKAIGILSLRDLFLDVIEARITT
jgi:CBS domain-containing protein